LEALAGPVPAPGAWPAAEPVKLSILVPAYNEERTIIRAIQEILDTEYPCAIELIVVDDGSSDRTPLLLAKVNDPRVRVHRHPTNLGKGAALLSAAALATGTHVMPFDADLEYSPEDIPKMLGPVLKGRCSVVYGARLFGCNTVYRSYRYAAGNKLLTNMINILFNACLTDLHTCFKLMPLPMLRGLRLREKGFGLDTEVTALILRLGIRPFEVPVSYYGRSHAQGKKITWRDAIVCARVLLQVRLRSKAQGEIRAGEHAGGEQPSALLPEHGSEQPEAAAISPATSGAEFGDDDGELTATATG